MKKTLGLLLVCGVLVLSGCMPNDQLSESELFEKKQECASMKNIIQSEQIQGINVSEVFYNQNMNTCLYVLQGNWVKFIIDRFWNEDQWLYNANSEIFCENTFWNINNNDRNEDLKECLKKSKEFDEKLKELKKE